MLPLCSNTFLGVGWDPKLPLAINAPKWDLDSLWSVWSPQLCLSAQLLRWSPVTLIPLPARAVWHCPGQQGPDWERDMRSVPLGKMKVPQLSLSHGAGTTAQSSPKTKRNNNLSPSPDSCVNTIMMPVPLETMLSCFPVITSQNYIFTLINCNIKININANL